MTTGMTAGAVFVLTGVGLAASAPGALAAGTGLGAGFAELLVAALAMVGAVLHLWLGLGAAVTAVAVGRSRLAPFARYASRLLVPGWWRRAVCWALGSAVAAVPLMVTGAAADDTGGGSGLGGLPFPDRPVGGSARAKVLVRPGDTLWSIAAAHLGRRAGDADVAAAWPAWYRANRPRIGPDPDLILPGTALTSPLSLRSDSGAADVH